MRRRGRARPRADARTDPDHPALSRRRPGEQHLSGAEVAWATGLVRQHAPDLATLALEPIGGGWDHVVLASETLVIRVPRRDGQALAAEAALLEQLAAHLSFAVPKVERLVRDADGTPVLLVESRLAGVRAEPGHLSAGQRRRLVAELGRLLAELVGLADVGRAAGVPEHRSPAEDLAVLHDLARSQLLPLLAAEVGQRLEQALAGLVTAARRAAAVGQALVHGDLDPANILIGADGAIRGVVDWSDAHVGDPATDLGGLAFCYGDDILTGVEEVRRRRAVYVRDLVRPTEEALEALAYDATEARAAIARLTRALAQAPAP